MKKGANDSWVSYLSPDNRQVSNVRHFAFDQGIRSFRRRADEPVCQSLLHRLTSRVGLPTCYDQCNNKQTNLFILSFRLCFHILMKKEKRNKRKPDILSSKYLTNSKFPLFKSQFANAFKCLTGQFASSFSSLAIKAKLKPV